MITSTVIGNFILVTGSFVTLLILIRVFAWKKVTAIFEERAQKISADLDSASSQRERAQELANQRQRELADSRLEAKKIIQEAVERAKMEKKHILEQAHEEAAALKEKAKLEIQAEKQEAQESLKVQVAQLAVDLAGKIILEDLDPAAHQATVDRYIDRLGDA